MVATNYRHRRPRYDHGQNTTPFAESGHTGFLRLRVPALSSCSGPLYATCVVHAIPSGAIELRSYSYSIRRSTWTASSPVLKPLAMTYDAHGRCCVMAVTSFDRPSVRRCTDLTKRDTRLPAFDYQVLPSAGHHEGQDRVEQQAAPAKKGRHHHRKQVLWCTAAAAALSLKAAFACARWWMCPLTRHQSWSSARYAQGPREMGISEFYFSLQDGVLDQHPYVLRPRAPSLTPDDGAVFHPSYQQYCTTAPLAAHEPGIPRRQPPTRPRRRGQRPR